MKRYHGLPGGRVSVVIDGESYPLDPRVDLVNHSPCGFAWGYGGSGPSQLALAILADFTEDDAFALSHYQAFKRLVIANLPPRVSFVVDGAEVGSFVSSPKRVATPNPEGDTP